VAPERKLLGIWGHIWEQLILPWHIKADELLWSPANIGPLGHRRQVLSLHDLSFIEQPGWFDARFAYWYRMVMPRLIRRTKAIITDSHFSKRSIQNAFQLPAEKIHVVPCGVDTTQFRPVPQAEKQRVLQKHQLPPRYLLSVGSLAPRKNLQGLLAAWRQLTPQSEDLCLVITGTKGSAFGRIEEPDDFQNVRWLGYVEERDLPALYSGAMAFISASFCEGFGLTPLEAMACRTPVIVSNRGALPEVVADAGYFFDPYEVDAICQAIAVVVSDVELRQELGERGYQRAQTFSWENTAGGVWNVLQAEMEK